MKREEIIKVCINNFEDYGLATTGIGYDTLAEMIADDLESPPDSKEEKKGAGFELQFCETCFQMTNHIDGICQKCRYNIKSQEQPDKAEVYDLISSIQLIDDDIVYLLQHKVIADTLYKEIERIMHDFAASERRKELIKLEDELVEIYKTNRVCVADICDKVLDKSGALLGRIRDKYLNYLNK